MLTDIQTYPKNLKFKEISSQTLNDTKLLQNPSHKSQNSHSDATLILIYISSSHHKCLEEYKINKQLFRSLCVVLLSFFTSDFKPKKKNKKYSGKKFLISWFLFFSSFDASILAPLQMACSSSTNNNTKMFYECLYFFFCLVRDVLVTAGNNMTW